MSKAEYYKNMKNDNNWMGIKIVELEEENEHLKKQIELLKKENNELKTEIKELKESIESWKYAYAHTLQGYFQFIS